MKSLHAVLLILALLPGVVLAEDDEKGGKYGGEDRGRTLQPAKLNPTWVKECSACHIPYAPGLLPAESWRKLMSGLNKHFGTDASLTGQEVQDVSAFLVANASNRWTGTGAPLRITETQWFKSKHSAEEVPPAVWKRASVKSASNCQACHAGADKADFNERSIKIPL
jgi:nitrate/TMAO reductase-like tetraheme cytochrome c subunit